MLAWNVVIFEYIFPSLGCILASLVFASPIRALSDALKKGSLDNLNPSPWAVMTGNCFGWCSYAWMINDPFVLASNLPGLVLSLWLNIGAAKLQYAKQIEDLATAIAHNRGSRAIETEDELKFKNSVPRGTSISAHGRIDNSKHYLTSTSQDVLVLWIITAWSIIIVSVGWLSIFRGYEQRIIGILVNINLIFFYGAPLQTMKIVLATKSSDSIFLPTVITNCINAVFWSSYGIAKNDLIIYGPNCIGLVLGLIQAVLCFVFPNTASKATKGVAVVYSTIKTDEGPCVELSGASSEF